MKATSNALARCKVNLIDLDEASLKLLLSFEQKGWNYNRRQIHHWIVMLDLDLASVQSRGTPRCQRHREVSRGFDSKETSLRQLASIQNYRDPLTSFR